LCVVVYRKPSQLLEVGPVMEDRIPVIKRFTGGGTVIVDKSTLFVSLICNKDDVPNVQPYPRSVMAWSGSLYDEVFKSVNGFQLRENGVCVCVCVLRLDSSSLSTMKMF